MVSSLNDRVDVKTVFLTIDPTPHKLYLNIANDLALEEELYLPSIWLAISRIGLQLNSRCSYTVLPWPITLCIILWYL
ncbi:hypothetical protein SDJN02_12134 [Cucurbita argyrosperma subsp. argyrosperma]